jgi:hypothetical protein
MAEVNRATAPWLLRAITLGAALLVACKDEVVPMPTDAAAVSSKDATDAGSEAQDASSETEPDVSSEAEPDVSSEAEIDAPAETNPVDTAILAAPDPTIPLAAKSPACLQCASDNCSNYIDGCASVNGISTDAGPAAGTPRAELCVETLSCLLSTGCISCDDSDAGCPPLAKFGACYCRWNDPIASSVPEFCLPPQGALAGPCRNELEQSFETTDSWTLLSSFADTSKGGGWAMQLMQCLVDNGCTPCFAPSGDPEAGAGD